MNRSATPLERPKALADKPLLPDEEVARMKKRAEQLYNDNRTDYLDSDSLYEAILGKGDFYKDPTGSLESNAVNIRLEIDNRTSLIIDPADGRLPPYTPEGKKRREAADALDTLKIPPTSVKDLAPYQRCIVNGVPSIGGNTGTYFQIVQTRDYVLIATEFIHETRIIPLDGRPHLPQSVRQWDGDPVGRWEGQTLVVDTTNFSAFNPFYGSVDGLHIVERFTRVALDEIRQEIRVEDPSTWTKPWTAVQRLKRTDERIFEAACHEGNSAVIEDMLSGGKPAKAR